MITISSEYVCCSTSSRACSVGLIILRQRDSSFPFHDKGQIHDKQITYVAWVEGGGGETVAESTTSEYEWEIGREKRYLMHFLIEFLDRGFKHHLQTKIQNRQQMFDVLSFKWSVSLIRIF